MNTARPQVRKLSVLLACILVSVLTMSSTVVEADTQTSSSNSSSSVISQVGSKQAASAVDIAAQYLQNLPNGAVADISHANVVSVKDTDRLVVAVETTGTHSVKGSFASAVVDLDSRSIVDTYQTKVTSSDHDRYKVASWVDGESTGHPKTVDVSEDTEVLQAQANKDGVLECLNSLGISVALGVILISSCAAACAVTVGAGCLACVAVITAFNGASVGKCLAQL